MKLTRAWIGGIILLAFIASACGAEQPSGAEPAPTPTSTLTTGAPFTSNGCDQLAGSLDVAVMAGPGEAVGLDPFSVGAVPFQVIADGDGYTIQGSGSSAYNQVLIRDWGTYDVSMNLDLTLSGTCRPVGEATQLDMLLMMQGSQDVVVEAPGLSGEYPWEGAASVDFSLPAEEGASASGEGWQVVLQLDR